jgi:integrase
MYLEIAPSGGRWWRWKYRYAGKEKRISLGTFPDVSLALARDRRDEARKLLDNGIDPSQQRKAEKAALLKQCEYTFQSIAEQWHEQRVPVLSAVHAEDIEQLLERDVYPHIGERPIAQIEAPELLALLRRIEARKVGVTTHRALSYIRMVFAYAIACGRCHRNPASDLRGALAPTKEKHLPAITTPAEFGNLLRALDSYRGTFVVECALKLAPLVAVRPGELRKAKWADINLESATWSFVASKTQTSHIVPLATQAVEILRELHKLTGNSVGGYVFPSARSARRPMSDNAVLVALRTLGFAKDVMTGHGFRTAFRTIGAEALRLKPELLEMQLAHTVTNPLGRAYDRTEFLTERTRMMQKWANYLDALRDGAEVIAMPKRA